MPKWRGHVIVVTILGHNPVGQETQDVSRDWGGGTGEGRILQTTAHFSSLQSANWTGQEVKAQSRTNCLKLWEIYLQVFFPQPANNWITSYVGMHAQETASKHFSIILNEAGR